MGYSKDALAANLRRLRREKGAREDRDVPQKEVADYCGVSDATILNYENGAGGVGFETAWRLAEFYGVSLDELGGRRAVNPEVSG